MVSCALALWRLSFKIERVLRNSAFWNGICHAFDVWRHFCTLCLQNKHANAIFLSDLFWKQMSKCAYRQYEKSWKFFKNSIHIKRILKCYSLCYVLVDLETNLQSENKKINKTGFHTCSRGNKKWVSQSFRFNKRSDICNFYPPSHTLLASD